jgi:hypothetical protein
MNTSTTMHPEKEISRTTINTLFSNIAIMTVILTLVAAAAIAAYTSSRPVVAVENSLAVPYSNALEMQYAQPWLEAQNRSVVAYSNALELQYAQPWLAAQNKPLVAYSNTLELQYAQPWLQAQNRPIASYSNALELQYAQPWLDAQQQINCSSSIEMLYACKYGFGLP